MEKKPWDKPDLLSEKGTAAKRFSSCNKRFILRPASEGIALDLSICLQDCELMFTEAG
jgi:hypothetical protein